MGFLSKFEGKMEETVEGVAQQLGGAQLSPVQIMKRAEKQMRREKMVGAGRQYAPTLYTVLVSEFDDARMFSYYPTLAGEVETYLRAQAAEAGLVMDGQPLVRFIADPQLKRGKFDVVAEMVAAQTVQKLRAEENARYGLDFEPHGRAAVGAAVAGAGAEAGAGFSGAEGVTGGAGRASDTFDNMGAGNRGGQPGAGNAEQPGVGSTAQPPAADDQVTVMFGTQGNKPTIQPGPRKSVQDAYFYDEVRDRAYFLTGKPQRVGREATNDVVVPDINVSRVHAEIRMEDNGTWVISDLGSTNGLYVNGRRVKSQPLKDADMVVMGTTKLEFQLLS
jgi:hypothetical protein